MKITPKQYAQSLYESLKGKDKNESKELIDNFVNTIIENNDTSKLEKIIEQFEKKWNQEEGIVDAEVVSFIDDMQQAYAWADLVVCRAGALTISELTAVGLGSLLIPFPYAVDNHQFHNARFLEQADAAQILNEAELSAESLALKLKFFQQNRPVLVEMAVNARARFQSNCTDRQSIHKCI